MTPMNLAGKEWVNCKNSSSIKTTIGPWTIIISKHSWYDYSWHATAHRKTMQVGGPHRNQQECAEAAVKVIRSLYDPIDGLIDAIGDTE